jgi:hypothetical protein
MQTNGSQVMLDGGNKLPRLGLKESMVLLRGALDTTYFNKTARPMLYEKCGNNPYSAEMVHELVLETMHRNRNMAGFLSPFFMHKSSLIINVNGVEVVPFGTAAGMDKNGEALAVLGAIFGFQETGTVVLHPREGNKKPRVAVDNANLDIYNAQGFPSEGIYHFLKNVDDYRMGGGKAVLYVSICGLPLSREDAVETANGEMGVLIARIGAYANGLVWNPFSPNTDALKLLRTPEVFYDTAQLMKD